MIHAYGKIIFLLLVWVNQYIIFELNIGIQRYSCAYYTDEFKALKFTFVDYISVTDLSYSIQSPLDLISAT